MKRRTQLSTLLLISGIISAATASAQWLGPWGSEDDLAAAWGLEPNTLNDPDEGPGETIDYNTPEQPFRMNVQSGNPIKPRTAAPVRPAPRPTPRIAAPAAPIRKAPAAITKARPAPPPLPARPAPRARTPYYAQRRAPAPIQRRVPTRVQRRAPAPRSYNSYRQPMTPMPYFMPHPFQQMQMPAARAPYPYYRR